MGTRGACGFRKDKTDKIAYNHYDSYPRQLGANVVKFCRETTTEEMNAIFDRIQLVSNEVLPTAKQIEECRPWLSSGVPSSSEQDWHCLLYKAQGNLEAYKTLRYMQNASDFIKNSLFCEYAYIINLDTNELEFWIGDQLEPQENNRYGVQPDSNGYYPCRLTMTFSLDSIFNDATKQMISKQNFLKTS